MPKVSIIIPVYNEEKYLKECIDSVLNQTLKDIEVICVDDGSTDASVQMMDEYMENDPRVRVIHKENTGYGNSMNRGILSAKGDYIGIVESDDSVIPKMFQTLYGLTEKGTVDIVKGNFWDCYDKGDGVEKVLNRERDGMPYVSKAFTIKEYPQLLWGHPSIWTAIYRREFLLENKIFFKEIKGGGWVDNPFFFDTLFQAKKIKWTPKPLYLYRKTNPNSSSNGYDLKIPFERMIDNLEVAEKDGQTDEETKKHMYARALMYLVGATKEKHYAYNEEYARPYIKKMLRCMDQNVITDDFNIYDQKNFWKFRSPLVDLYPKTKKILIYNWVPFDNPSNAGGGVTIYCRNLISSILRYRPDVQVYFLSSGWAYDVTSTDCYIRKIDNIFGEQCKAYEIVNSPVPAPQDMLFYNPEIAFESPKLKDIFGKFIESNGPFESIHFNNIEGISLDVLSIKEEYPQTSFVYSMHNYVPICATGFYFRRDLHCNCAPDHTAEDCGKCINRGDGRRLRREMINRGRANIPDAERYDEDRWALSFGFEKLEEIKSEKKLFEFAERAKSAINQYCDLVLAVSERVREIAEDNGIRPELIHTSYIGTKVANYQLRKSNSTPEKKLRIVFLGSDVAYEEKGYPFLLQALHQMPAAYAEQVELVLTTTTTNQDDKIRFLTKNFNSVKIIHGYSHADLYGILNGCHLGIIPVLWEDNLPQIAIEMVAYGVPVLCSNAGGASELCSSEKFVFEAGNQEDFINKLEYLIDHPQEISEYWDNHTGLVTLEQHFDEMQEYLRLGDFQDTPITLSVEEYNDLLSENNFLYQNLSYERDELNRFRADHDRLRADLDRIRADYDRRLDETIKQRDYLQYVIDETRKSKTYKIGRIFTAIPRAIRRN